MKPSRELAIPLSGVQQLNLINDKPNPALEYPLAAWQTTLKGVPKRVVVRCDGNITNVNADNSGNNIGYPCGVLEIRYSIGGYVRSVKIDAVNQSALVVWATSIEVSSIWDIRRIERLRRFYGGERANVACSGQIVAASISVDPGDTGPADARYLDVVTFNNEVDNELSIHPIPPGARAVRILNSTLLEGGSVIPVITYLQTMKWGNMPDGNGPYIHQEILDDYYNEFIPVPAGASFLYLVFQNGETAPDEPFFVEWLISPEMNVQDRFFAAP